MKKIIFISICLAVASQIYAQKLDRFLYFTHFIVGIDILPQLYQEQWILVKNEVGELSVFLIQLDRYDLNNVQLGNIAIEAELRNVINYTPNIFVNNLIIQKNNITIKEYFGFAHVDFLFENMQIAGDHAIIPALLELRGCDFIFWLNFAVNLSIESEEIPNHN